MYKGGGGTQLERVEHIVDQIQRFVNVRASFKGEVAT